METQNNAEVMVKKPKKKGKIVVWIIIACAVVAAVVAAIFMIPSLFVSPAEKTVRTFMEAFKNNDYYDMGMLCDICTFDDEELGIYSYSGTNMIDYNIKSVSGPYKVAERLTAKRYSNDTDAEFQESKERTDKIAQIESREYGIEFVVAENSGSKYVLESKEEVLDEYMVTLDVQYSTILGNIKRNVVTITVCQTDIDSNTYKITDIVGIIH